MRGAILLLLALAVHFATCMRVLVISARGEQCYNPVGDYLMTLFLKSAVDWCTRHGYEFSFRTNQANKLLPLHWNKLGHLLEVFGPTSNYEWIMWLDNDTLVTRPQDAVDFAKYPKHIDIVLVGRPNEFKKPKVDMFQALNTGVMLLRNSAGSRAFLHELVQLALMSDSERESKYDKRYDNWRWLQDQAAVTWLVHRGMPNVFVDSCEYLNGFWEGYKGNGARNVLIKHWAGCKFCERPKAPIAKQQECIDDYLQNYRGIYETGP